MFELNDEDSYAIEIAQNTVRRLLQQPTITPEEIIGLGNALYALEKLPKATSGVNCEFGISYRAGNDEFKEMVYIAFRIADDIFEIAKGGSVYSSDVGSDTIPAKIYAFDITGARRNNLELSYLEDSIIEYLNLGAEISVNDESEIDFS